MAQFSVHDAKTNLSRLIADALAGGEVVIARGNVPAVRLVPVNPRGKRRFGALNLKGFVRLDNIFDHQYVGSVIVGDSNGRFYESAPGRNWLAGISARYSF